MPGRTWATTWTTPILRCRIRGGRGGVGVRPRPPGRHGRRRRDDATAGSAKPAAESTRPVRVPRPGAASPPRRTRRRCSGPPGRSRAATRPTPRCGPGSACRRWAASRASWSALIARCSPRCPVLPGSDAPGHRRQGPRAGLRRRHGRRRPLPSVDARAGDHRGCPAPTPHVYTVVKGDTMTQIARKFGVTVEQLRPPTRRSRTWTRSRPATRSHPGAARRRGGGRRSPSP